LNAWLLTWEGTTGPAIVPDKKIVAILSSRKSSTVIADIVALFYCHNVDCVFDWGRENPLNLTTNDPGYAGAVLWRVMAGDGLSAKERRPGKSGRWR